jgi:menaquinone-dependent protoporphyrinogen oxidase
MTVLVAAASRHGATREIAEAIAQELGARGVEADVADVEQVDDVAGYEAVVLGSAIYMGKWLEPARLFVDLHAETLSSRPTWLFSSGPVGAPPKPDAEHAVELGSIVDRVDAHDHRVFAGRLERSDLGLGERVAAGALRAQYGDFRDWEAVATWADGIADRLRDGAP